MIYLNEKEKGEPFFCVYILYVEKFEFPLASGSVMKGCMIMKRNLTKEVQKMPKSDAMLKCLWKRAGYHFMDAIPLNNDKISKGIYVPLEMMSADTDKLLRGMLQHELLSVAAIADQDYPEFLVMTTGVIVLYQTESQLKIIKKGSNPVLIDEASVVPVIRITGDRKELFTA